MAIYEGETITFKTSATNVDDAKTALTDSDVTSTEITIIDQSDNSVVLAATPMVYDATDVEWRYTWTTPVTGSGASEKYTARLRLIGATFDTWEYQKVTVKAALF